MEPFLTNGARVRVKGSRRYWPGDILAYRDRNGRMVTHRLLGYYRRHGSWKLLIQADSAVRPDHAVDQGQVLGKVADIRIQIPQRLRAVARYWRYAFIGRWTPSRPLFDQGAST